MFQLIISDLDNTLLNSKKELTPYTAGVLSAYQRAGCRVAFATARPYRATQVFQTLFRPDFVIANNGANIYRAGRQIFSLPIPAEQLQELLALPALCAEAESCLYTNIPGDDQDFARHQIVYTDFCEPPPTPIYKIIVDGNIITHREAGKMNAVLYLAREYGIDIKRTVAFGDGLNDIEMLAGVGHGVAVANACAEAKRAAAALCGSNDEDGVSRWLEQNGAKKARGF